MPNRDVVQLALLHLAHTNKTVRKSAARQLAAAPNRDNALSLLQALIREPEPSVIKWLAFALARIGDRSFAHDLFKKADKMNEGEPREWVRLSALMLESAGQVAKVADLIESSDRSSLTAAAQLIWAGGGYEGQYEKRLLRLAEHEDPTVRRWSILALGKGGGLKSAVDISHGLNDSNYLVREWTECAIGSLADKSTTGLLIPGLDDPHPRVREWAIKALTSASHPELPVLLTAHLSFETDPQCREAIFRALLILPSPKTLSEVVLCELSCCKDPIVFLSIIDLVISKEELRANNDLIVELAKKAALCDEKLLCPYLAQQLKSSLTDSQKTAISLFQSDPSVGIVLRYSNSTHSASIMPADADQVDLGIVIALVEEFREFVTVVQEVTPVGKSMPNQYRFSTRQGVKGIAVLVGKKGIPAALVAARELMNIWNPKLIVNIGIAGSMHVDLRLGDVLIASQVSDYLQDSKASATPEGWEFHLSGEPYKTNALLLKVAQNFEFTDTIAHHDWQLTTKENCEQLVPPPALEELLAKSQIRKDAIVTDGRLASGPVVGAASSFVSWLQKHDRAFKAIEMESAGVMAGAENVDGTLAMSVRGISDFADERKTDLEASSLGSIRQLAMRNASNWVLMAAPALLENILR